MRIRLLTGEDLEKVLPMDLAVRAMAEAFSQFSAGEADVPLRTRLETPKGETLFMPAYLRRTGDLAAKIVSVFPGNMALGLPTVPGMVISLDAHTGLPLAIMDGHALTALRTGAAGGLAAQLLSREEAAHAVVFGAGTQGWAQIRGVLAVRKIRRVWIVDPAEENRKRLADRLRCLGKGLEVLETDRGDDAVERADIIITATPSPTPVFDGTRVRPGTHINAIGSYRPDMCELDAHIVRKAKVFVDSRRACMAEAGDIIQSGAKILAEIGEVINGAKPGRTSPDEITVFKTVGIAAQDAAAASAALKRAEEKNLGTLISLG
ncbi:MAG: hypothetical protein WHS86_05720 [Desulfosoma sp.]